MAKREHFLTAEGATRLRKELELLKGPRRTELAGRLRHAVQMGDLSENADYTVAKEDQAFLEGRILELETILREAVIVEGAAADVAAVGATVIVSESGGPAETFQLVGVKEADPRQGRISHESPIGLALLGHRAGDTVQAVTPGGTLTFKILEVR
ncbi:MAG: transcription elongation factor GreA [Chloroflexi bacterium RBG_13_68_17]|nr:MAG: transcription elongation factor GreA [Chloroflexi bacterium RBG_13_68_17]